MCVSRPHMGRPAPQRWLSPCPLFAVWVLFWVGRTYWKHYGSTVCCVLQVGSARDGRAPGVPPTSPLHLPTVGAAVAPKWSRSPSVRSVFYAVCYLSFIQLLQLEICIIFIDFRGKTHFGDAKTLNDLYVCWISLQNGVFQYLPVSPFQATYILFKFCKQWNVVSLLPLKPVKLKCVWAMTHFAVDEDSWCNLRTAPWRWLLMLRSLSSGKK